MIEPLLAISGERIFAIISTVIASVLVVGLAGAIVFGARQVVLRRRQTARLREQIASDLHDDIGSNLGSIALISQLGLEQDSLPGEARSDFHQIHKIAERTAQAMRDIVWLIDPDNSSSHDLVTKMRRAVLERLGDIDHEFKTTEAAERKELPLEFRRHLYFAFKEAVNNVARHADATRIDVELCVERRRVRFVIRDNGKGFDVESIDRGHGLNNIKRRADKLKARLSIDSKPGEGTTVTFDAPLQLLNFRNV
ncbi:MAG: signal transduction histidine kinase [Verrucomicrobiales bacterium]|jgi:signal transduction histidine kinase